MFNFFEFLWLLAKDHWHAGFIGPHLPKPIDEFSLNFYPFFLDEFI